VTTSRKTGGAEWRNDNPAATWPSPIVHELGTRLVHTGPVRARVGLPQSGRRDPNNRPDAVTTTAALLLMEAASTSGSDRDKWAASSTNSGALTGGARQ